MNDQILSRAISAIENADALMITAGAGIGVDSGLPDFRGDEGFWKAYPPIAKRGIRFTEMANPGWFKSDPGLAWAFYGHRLNLYRNTVPHQGFSMLLELGQNMSEGYFVFTSNVDGQFQEAGFENSRIAECHGSIHHFQCSHPCNDDIWDAVDEVVVVDEESFEARQPLPRCKSCGELARPNILMFGDWGWVSERSSDQESRLSDWLSGLRERSKRLVVIEIGAGQAVPTVRMQSENMVSRLNATLIRINPREDHVPTGQISIRAGGLEGIKAICSL